MKQPEIKEITGEVRVVTKLVTFFGRRVVAKIQVLNDGAWTTVNRQNFPVDIRSDAFESMKNKARTMGLLPRHV